MDNNNFDEFISPKEQKDKSTSILIALLILIIVAGLLFYGYKKYKEYEYENEYQKNYDTAVYSMLHNTANGEDLLNELLDVWHNSIWQIEDNEIDIYTKDANGNFYEDFNDALDVYYASEAFNDKYSEIVSNDNDIQAIVRKLNDPPKKFETAYEKFIDYYSWYSEFIDLAMNQNNMSYKEVSEQYDSLENEFKGIYSKVQMFTSY